MRPGEAGHLRTARGGWILPGLSGDSLVVGRREEEGEDVEEEEGEKDDDDDDEEEERWRPGVEQGDPELQGGEVANPGRGSRTPPAHRVHQEEPTK